MALHWTYVEYSAEDDLRQGDIIAPAGALGRALHETHGEWWDQRLVALLVLTQTCDLVLRGEHCKARQIALAPVVELEPLIPQILERVCGTGIQGIYKKEERTRAIETLRKIINQNDQAGGLFYLHPDLDSGITTSSVARIRAAVTVPRRWYLDLIKGRQGRLEGAFENKLGWLTGNLYSRVGTPDWDEMGSGPRPSHTMAAKLLENAVGSEDRWVTTASLRSAEKAGARLAELGAEEAIEQLKEHAPPSPEEALSRQLWAISCQTWARRVKQAVMSDLSEHADLVDWAWAALEQDERQALAGVKEALRAAPDVRKAMAVHLGNLIYPALASASGHERLRENVLGEVADARVAHNMLENAVRRALHDVGEGGLADQFLCSQLFAAPELEEYLSPHLSAAEAGLEFALLLCKRAAADAKIRAHLKKPT